MTEWKKETPKRWRRYSIYVSPLWCIPKACEYYCITAVTKHTLIIALFLLLLLVIHFWLLCTNHFQFGDSPLLFIWSSHSFTGWLILALIPRHIHSSSHPKETFTHSLNYTFFGKINSNFSIPLNRGLILSSVFLCGNTTKNTHSVRRNFWKLPRFLRNKNKTTSREKN